MHKVDWHNEKVRVQLVGHLKQNTETAFQIYVADYLRKCFKVSGKLYYKYWHHSANERVGASAGMLAKMMGQEAGWPDFVNCQLMVALELKLKGGRLSSEQKKVKRYFQNIGWKYYQANHFSEVEIILHKELKLEKPDCFK